MWSGKYLKKKLEVDSGQKVFFKKSRSQFYLTVVFNDILNYLGGMGWVLFDQDDPILAPPVVINDFPIQKNVFNPL